MATLEVNINIKDIDTISDLLKLMGKYYNEMPLEIQKKLIEIAGESK